MTKRRTTVEHNRELREVLVDVPENEPASWSRDAELSVVGKAFPRLEGHEKVTGGAKYTFDVNLPNMLWMKILRSPHPHARIRAVDTSRAEAVPGVVLVLTDRNVPDIPWHHEHSRLFDSTMRYVGDEVAAVVAETEAIARDALELIDVEYEELPFVLDPETARRPDSPSLFEGGNVWEGKPSILSRGDVEKGFAESDVIVEASFRSQNLMHSCMEPHCSVAEWKDGKLTVWESTQSVHVTRRHLARTLGLKESDVRVIMAHIGGGFGSKGPLDKHTVLAALAARETGRPVKVVPERKDEAHSAGNRPSNRGVIRAGCKKDGTLTAMSFEGVGTLGAYPYFFMGATCASVFHDAYRCPNVRTEEYEVFINADPSRPHRAPGDVQGTWMREQVIDMLAEKCGLDPLELRLRNYAEVNPMRSDMPYTQNALRECYERGAEAFGWKERKTRKEAQSKGSKRRGYGMATGLWGGGGGPPGFAVVKLFPDGTATVLSGAQDIGTGTRTVLWQVAAEELGLPPERIRMVIGDSESCPYGDISGGSRTIGSMSPAVRMAAADAKRQLLELVADEMGVPAGRLDARDGFIFDTEDPSHRKPFQEMAGKMEELDVYGLPMGQNQMIVGTGFRGPNPEGYAINTWCVQFAEVEVDTDTGQVRVVRVVSANESGRVVNPNTYTNQIEGGVIQGIGIALYEERVLDEVSGRILNANLHDYKIPTAMDIPEIEVVPVDVADVKANSCGVKGLGEPPIVPTPGAIANAVYDAIGVRLTRLPMTPPRVLEALEEVAP